jgi:hypothetical protein
MSVLTYRTQTDAVSLLQNLARQNAPLRMSRTFRGMLFTQDLSIVSLGSDRGLFKGARSRLATGLGDRIYLHGPGLREALSARVLEMDVQLGRFLLGEFVQTGRPWAERSQERVQPRRPIRVMLRCEEHSMPASLENISLIGVGLLAYKSAERGLDLRVGSQVTVDFELPVLRGRVSLPGRLVNVVYPGARLACLGVHTLLDMNQARVVERYVTHRKAEIVDELDSALNAAFEPRGVKELYF